MCDTQAWRIWERLFVGVLVAAVFTYCKRNLDFILASKTKGGIYINRTCISKTSVFLDIYMLDVTMHVM